MPVLCDQGSARGMHREAWAPMGHLRLERAGGFLQRGVPKGSEYRTLHRTEPEDQENVSRNRAPKTSLP